MFIFLFLCFADNYCAGIKDCGPGETIECSLVLEDAWGCSVTPHSDRIVCEAFNTNGLLVGQDISYCLGLAGTGGSGNGWEFTGREDDGYCPVWRQDCSLPA